MDGSALATWTRRPRQSASARAELLSLNPFSPIPHSTRSITKDGNATCGNHNELVSGVARLSPGRWRCCGSCFRRRLFRCCPARCPARCPTWTGNRRDSTSTRLRALFITIAAIDRSGRNARRSSSNRFRAIAPRVLVSFFFLFLLCHHRRFFAPSQTAPHKSPRRQPRRNRRPHHLHAPQTRREIRRRLLGRRQGRDVGQDGGRGVWAGRAGGVGELFEGG